MGVAFFKKTWFTSDWHLGHANVLKFCAKTRPFQTLEEMTHRLIDNYNQRVKEGDTCYFLGDFAFKLDVGREALLQLKGSKILVIGNHDKGMQSCKNMGFDAVVSSLSIKTAGIRITCSHFPLFGVWREDCKGFKNYNGEDRWHGELKYSESFDILEDTGQTAHLHGHLHSPNGGISSPILGRQLDVGVDCRDLSPISLNHAMKLIRNR